MRVITPVVKLDDLECSRLLRLMQANFDTALDARYAIAHEQLWSVFIHPLASLDDRQLIEAIGQVVNLANTYGTTYTSGRLMFGGGDSAGIKERELIEELIERGMAI